MSPFGFLSRIPSLCSRASAPTTGSTFVNSRTSRGVVRHGLSRVASGGGIGTRSVTGSGLRLWCGHDLANNSGLRNVTSAACCVSGRRQRGDGAPPHSITHVSLRGGRGGPTHGLMQTTATTATTGNVGVASCWGPAGQKRTVISAMSPFMLKIIVGGIVGGSYIGYQSIMRASFVQLWRVATTLNLPYIGDNAPLINWSTRGREGETDWLKRYLKAPPMHPLVLVGPTGSGKGGLVRHVIKGERNAVFIDLKEQAMTTGEEFIFSFIQKLGYLTPPQDTLIAQVFLRSKKNNELIGKEELNRALGVIEKALVRQKNKGWPNGIPVIIVNDIHDLGPAQIKKKSASSDLSSILTRKKNMAFLDDPHMLMFVDYLIHLVDTQLSNVLLITTYSFVHQELDKHTGFKLKRELASLDFPPAETLQRYLLHGFNDTLKANNQTPLSTKEVLFASSALECNGTDVDILTSALLRGASCIPKVKSMLGDSVQQIEDKLEDLLEAAHTAKHSDDDVNIEIHDELLRKYLRFWSMMGRFAVSDYGAVPRRHMIQQVFGGHAYELEEYEDESMITQHNLNALPTTTSLNVVQDDHTESEAEDDNDYTSEVSSLYDILEETVGVSHAEEEEKTAKPARFARKYASDHVLRGYDSMSPASVDQLEGIQLKAASARLNLAFSIVCNDKRLTLQRDQIMTMLRTKRLKLQAKDIAEEKKALLDEKKLLIDDTKLFLSELDAYKEVFGDDEFERKRSILKQRNSTLGNAILHVNQRHGRIARELALCQRETKANLDKRHTVSVY
eukprot:TRINITY_DN6090_c0_g1_i2.p1 TRINITY_DN6090_c0_g1~~TRINITY_DN6090_c0_g1_i2.p1  ORF type:complete len:790 (-),score=154.91 TRINITY_DN6090_c0_g1_i2:199-2568(-)